LKDNAELTKEIYEKISNSNLRLTGAMADQVTHTKNLLEMLMAVQNQYAIMDANEFQKAYADVMKQMSGVSGLDDLFGVSYSDRQEAIKFYETLPKTAGKLTEQVGKGLVKDITALMKQGYKLTEEQTDMVANILDDDALMASITYMNNLVLTTDDAKVAMAGLNKETDDITNGISTMGEDIKNLTQEIYDFSGAREELFFGGKFGNVTGSLYKQVVQQGVGTLYHKNEIIMTNNFNGFFNEQEAASRIVRVLEDYLQTNDSSLTSQRR